MPHGWRLRLPHGAPLAFAAVFLLGAPVANGQSNGRLPAAAAMEPPQAAPTADPRERIDARRAELERQTAATKQRLLAAAGADEVAAALAGELDALERLDRLYRQQLDAIERSEDLARAQSAADKKLAAGPSSGVGQAPPFGLALADILYETLRGHMARGETIEAAARAAEEAVENRRRQLDEREKERRRIKEEAEAEKRELEAAALRKKLRDAEFESQLAQARLELAELELGNTRQQRKLQQRNQKFIAATLEWVQQNLALRREEIEEPLARLDKRDFDLQRALDRANLDLASAEVRLAGAQKRLAAEADPTPALVAEAEARRLARQVFQHRVSFLDAETDRVAASRQLWQRRYQTLASQTTRSQLREWNQQIEDALEERDRQRRLAEARLAEIGRSREQIAARAEVALEKGLPEARWLGEQEALLADLARVYQDELDSLREGAALAERTLASIQSRNEQASLADRLFAAWERLAGVWDIEITAVDDRPITVGKVIAALLLFIVGYVFSRLLSRFLGRLLHRRLSLAEGAAAAFQGLTFYLLVVVFFLFALRTVGIPLTAFTVLGGALAIGIGFGSQNIVNNFISGLILLAERPIKVGDIVELDSTTGRIERIGARSTRVRTFDNIHIIVPNSAFLERNVVNWTLSDDIVRGHVDLGVAYGSPTRQVEKLLLRVLDEHGRILDQPPPVVLFTDFAENALNFRAYFWIRVRDVLDRRRIESDVRYRVDHLFRDAGVTIAFPQRDVHLDASRPVPVQLMAPESNGREEER